MALLQALPPSISIPPQFLGLRPRRPRSPPQLFPSQRRRWSAVSCTIVSRLSTAAASTGPLSTSARTTIRTARRRTSRSSADVKMQASASSVPKRTSRPAPSSNALAMAPRPYDQAQPRALLQSAGLGTPDGARLPLPLRTPIQAQRQMGSGRVRRRSGDAHDHRRGTRGGRVPRRAGGGRRPRVAEARLRE